MASKTTPKQKDSFVNSLSTSRLIIGAVAVSAVCVVVAFIVGRALIGNLVLNAKVINKKSAANKQISTNYDNLKAMQTDYDALGATRDVINNSLPTKPDLPALWAMLENIGTTSGVSTTTVGSPVTADQVAAPARSPQAVEVNVAVAGSYASIQNYLKNLELSARPFRVTSITMSGTTSNAQATVTMTTYYQGPANLKVGSEVVQ